MLIQIKPFYEFLYLFVYLVPYCNMAGIVHKFRILNIPQLELGWDLERGGYRIFAYHSCNYIWTFDHVSRKPFWSFIRYVQANGFHARGYVGGLPLQPFSLHNHSDLHQHLLRLPYHWSSCWIWPLPSDSCRRLPYIWKGLSLDQLVNDYYDTIRINNLFYSD